LANPSPAAPEIAFQKESLASPEISTALDSDLEDEKRLIPFPATTSDDLIPVPSLQPNSSSQKPGKKSKNLRAV
jgi:hypothetical protein